MLREVGSVGAGKPVKKATDTSRPAPASSSPAAAPALAAEASLEQAVAALLPPRHPGGAPIARWLREDGVETAEALAQLLSSRDKAAGKRALVESGVKEAWAEALVEGFWRRGRQTTG